METFFRSDDFAPKRSLLRFYLFSIENHRQIPDVSMGICPNWFDLEKFDLSSLYMRFDFFNWHQVTRSDQNFKMWSNLLQPLRQACTGPKADEAETVETWGKKMEVAVSTFVAGVFLSVETYKIP